MVLGPARSIPCTFLHGLVAPGARPVGCQPFVQRGHVRVVARTPVPEHVDELPGSRFRRFRLEVLLNTIGVR
jgi:hypothetical protein